MIDADHLLLKNETVFHLELYAAIGRVVVGWGMVENHLDLCLMLLYHNLGGKTVWKKNLPKPISAKIELWQKCFETIPEIAHLKQAAREFATLLTDAANDRNKVFHYSWIDIIGKQDRSDIKGHAIVPTKDDYNTHRTSINSNSLIDLACDLDGLNTKLLGYSLTLMQLQRRPDA